MSDVFEHFRTFFMFSDTSTFSCVFVRFRAFSGVFERFQETINWENTLHLLSNLSSIYVRLLYSAVNFFFAKITSQNIKKRLKNPKHLKNFRKRWNAFKCFWMHPNASQWVRTDPNGSEQVWKPRKTHENLQKVDKNIAKNCRRGGAAKKSTHCF